MAELTPPVSDTGGQLERPYARDRAGATLRILTAMTRLTAARGFTDVTLASLLKDAGAARATFYKHFRDKRDCLLAAQRHWAQCLTGALDERPGDPWSALAEFAAREPAAVVILAEAQIADEAALAEHDRIRDALGVALEGRARPAAASSTQGLPAGLLTGAVMRVLAQHTREDAIEPEAVSSEIRRWVERYVGSGSDLYPHAAIGPLAADWPPSSTRLESSPPDSSSDSQRQSILRAVVLAPDHGDYQGATVGELASAAGVSRDAFYTHFAGKAEAFEAAHETIFGDLVALCMRAFAEAEDWPEQVWSVAHACASFFAVHPALARFVFVDSLSSGRAAAKRKYDEYTRAFTLFLAPSDRARVKPSPGLDSQLVAAALFELAYEHVRAGHTGELSSLLPLAAHIALTPFIGVDAARSFVTGKLAKSGPRRDG